MRILAGTPIALATLATVLLATAARAQTVTWWNQGDASVGTFSEAVADSFAAAHPPASAAPQLFPNEAYKTILQVAVGASNEPDVFFNWGGEGTFRFVRAGRLHDVTEAAARAGVPAPLLAAFSPDGERAYGIPLTQHTVAFLYNEAMFARFGVTPPETLAELASVCRTLRATDPDLIPISFGAKEPWTIIHYLTMLFERFVPAEVRRDDDALRASPDALYAHPGYLEGLAALRGLQDAGCFNRGINSVAPEEARAFFALEIAAMTFCGTWCLEPVDRAGLAGEYGLFPMPAAPGGAGDQAAVFVVPEGFNVSARSENPEAAERLLTHLYSAEVQAVMVRDLGRLPVNPAALDRVETSAVFADAVALTAAAPSTVISADMSMDFGVGRALGTAAQTFVNEQASAGDVMAAVRAAARRAQARRTRLAERAG